MAIADPQKAARRGAAPLRAAWRVFRDSYRRFVEDNVVTLGAALAFYSALALSPLLVILLSIAGLLDEGAQRRLVQYIADFAGERGGEVLWTVLRDADLGPQAGVIAAGIGFFALLFSATGFFAQLQMSLNRLWRVEPAPAGGLWGFIRRRVLSFGMLLAVAFLLVVSLMVHAIDVGETESDARALARGIASSQPYGTLVLYWNPLAR
jgi:membrane protein